MGLGFDREPREDEARAHLLTRQIEEVIAVYERSGDALFLVLDDGSAVEFGAERLRLTLHREFDRGQVVGETLLPDRVADALRSTPIAEVHVSGGFGYVESLTLRLADGSQIDMDVVSLRMFGPDGAPQADGECSTYTACGRGCCG